MVTYTLPEESGASLRGAGWELVVEETGHANWNREGRYRKASAHTGSKRRWQVTAGPAPMVKPDFVWAVPSPQLELPLAEHER